MYFITSPKDAMDAVEMDLPDAVVHSLLLKHKSEVSGPDRALFVIACRGTEVVFTRVRRDAPIRLDFSGNSFDDDLINTWKHYEVGKEVPVLISRLVPTPFTGLKLIALPWAKEIACA